MPRIELDCCFLYLFGALEITLSIYYCNSVYWTFHFATYIFFCKDQWPIRILWLHDEYWCLETYEMVGQIPSVKQLIVDPLQYDECIL